jgi:hypothetical protein
MLDDLQQTCGADRIRCLTIQTNPAVGSDIKKAYSKLTKKTLQQMDRIKKKLFLNSELKVAVGGLTGAAA